MRTAPTGIDLRRASLLARLKGAYIARAAKSDQGTLAACLEALADTHSFNLAYPDRAIVSGEIR